MRDLLNSYQKFSRMEQRGIIGLCILACMLLIILFTLRYWVRPPQSKEDAQLITAWNEYKTHHEKGIETKVPPGKLSLFPFDPNTLDSSGFITLGLRPKTIHLLLNWRRKGKVFYRKEDLQPLYTLKAEEYVRLAPYIRISASANTPTYAESSRPSLPAFIDLNKADSSLLVQLRGIGPTLAHKILERRKLMGGYLKHEQLNEIYHFPDTVYQMLCEKLIIHKEDVHRLSLNNASLEQMKAHPYIGEKMAKNILLYREGLKRFENIEQLRQVPLMNEEIYRKIAPYFTLD